VYLLTKIHAKDTRRYTRFLHKAKIHFRSSPKCRFHGLRITAEVKPSLPPSSGEGNGMMEEGRDGDGPGRVEWPCGAGVTLSEESGTGFLNVLKQPGGRKKPFYVKFKPDGEKRQRMLPGSSSATAWEAACKYGFYLATKAELPETEPRKARRPSEVSCAAARCDSFDFSSLV
jgi:hypothetical protein